MNKFFPLVSIICTSYNHEDFIEEALDSIFEQYYQPIELIIIDNGSKDKSALTIKNWIETNKPRYFTKIIFHNQPLPYCMAFNEALFQANGKYIVDFSGDDILQPNHLSHSVKRLENASEAAFCFTDLITFKGFEEGKTFYSRDIFGNLLEEVREGNRYLDLIQSHCINSATLLLRKEYLIAEGGYDEGLTYEDFDIMVRLARKFSLVFSDHIGIKKRLHKASFGSHQYQPYESAMLPSTLKICHKIKKMNLTPEEDSALLKRVMFETKHALASANFKVAKQFLKLAQELGGKGWNFWFFRIWSKSSLNFSWLYVRLRQL